MDSTETEEETEEIYRKIIVSHMFHKYCLTGDIDGIKTLVQHDGIGIVYENMSDTSMNTPLYIACEHGNLKL